MRTNRYHQLKESAYLRKGKGKGKTGKTGRTPLRLLSAGLSLSMLLTGCGPLSVAVPTVPDGMEQLESALQEGYGYDTGTDTVVTGFAGLPEEIRTQSVPLGTTIAGLTLPDTLEASIVVVKDTENEGGGVTPPEDTEKTPGDEDDGDKTPGEGGTETPGETGEDGTPENGESGTGTPGENGEGAPENGEGGTGTPGENGDGTPENGNDGTGTPGENGEGAPENGNDGTGTPGENGEGGTPENGEVSTETPGENEGGIPENDNNGTETPENENSGTEEAGGSNAAEPQSESAPIENETEQADETARIQDSALLVQSGVFVMPVYLSEPAAPAQPQTLDRSTESVMITGVTWQSDPAYDGNTEGTYTFTAILPGGYAPAEGVSLPQITVTVQGEDPVVQKLLARIAALPEAETYLAGEPDVEAEDEYEAWMDELSAYVEEALAVWEAYEALTAAQQARIPQEALAKLTAWVELAEQLAEGSQVMAAEDGWNDFGEGYTTKWKLEGNTLTISGTGTMPNWKANTDNPPPWHGSEDGIVYAKIDEGVTNIGSLAFRDCKALTDIDIPNSVTSIGNDAFSCCSALTSITIPAGVTSISGSTFFCCYKLTSITIPNSVTSIGGSAFFECASLTDIRIPNSVRSIGVSAFAKCSGLTSITIPNSVTSIERSAFSTCTKLLSVTFTGGGSIPTLGEWCFNNCHFVKENKTGLNVPSCKYLTASGWSQYKNNVNKQHTMTHTDKGLACSGCGMTYSEKITAENCDVVAAVAGENYTVTFKPDSGYAVPTGVTVTIGGTALVSNDEYTYTTDSATGTLRIPIGKITGDVIITATAEVKQVTMEVTLKKDRSPWIGQTVTLKRNGITYTAVDDGSGNYQYTGSKGGAYTIYVNNKSTGIWFDTDINGSVFRWTVYYLTMTYNANGADGTVPPKKDCNCGRKESTGSWQHDVDSTLPMKKPGCVQTGWSETPDGSSGIVKQIVVNDGAGNVRETPITLYPVFAPATVTINAPNCTHNGAAEVAATGDYTVTFKPDSGYDIPTGVTVKIGNTMLGSGEYIYNSTTGTLTIPRSEITGNVTITATAGQHVHDLRYKANDSVKKIYQSCNSCNHESNAGMTLRYATSIPCTYTGSELRPYMITRLTSWLDPLPSISYEKNVNVGEAKATLSIGGESVSITFKIVPKSLEDTSVTVTLSSDPYQYTGQAITPMVTVKDGNTTLVENRDYTVTYANNTAVGTATVTVTGMSNYSGTRTLTFSIQDEAPEVSVGDLNLSGGTVTLPPDIKDKVEIYDSEGNPITPNPDGSLPVEPGTTIKIKYPGSDKETVITIPDRPAAPNPPDEGAIEREGTTITVPKPDDGKEYEFVLVEKGKEPDWSNPNTSGQFTGLDPDKEYDIYMREAATENSFASEPVKIEIGTSGTIPTPTPGGEGAGKPGNEVSEGEPSADGKEVTYEGTCSKDYTPVITIGDKTYTPTIIWNEDGTEGTWTVTVPAPAAGDKPAVNFNSRQHEGLDIKPDKLRIYADDNANESAEALAEYLRANCVVKAKYDNGTSDDIAAGADYETQGSFAPRGGTYKYTVKAAGDTRADAVTLTVSPLTAAVTTPPSITKECKPTGYTEAEIKTFLPATVTVTYTGDGYAGKTEEVAAAWDTAFLGAELGKKEGSKTVTGTAALPEWATGDGAVTVGITFEGGSADIPAAELPVPGGDGAGKGGNEVKKGTVGADGKEVTYTGTCDKDYTPVITIGGVTYTPTITWNGDGTGTWTVTVPAKETKPEINFNTRVLKGVEIGETALRIHADRNENKSAETLLTYVKTLCAVKKVYDNGVKEAVTGAAYETADTFERKGKTYTYTVKPDGDAGNNRTVTLTVDPVAAAVTTPQAVTKNRKADGYTAAEVSGWLPKKVTVTYTGNGYETKTEDTAVTWDTASLGADTGKTAGSKKINGTAALPEWASGNGAVSITLTFADRRELTAEEMSLSVPGFAYGAEAAPKPQGSVTVADTDGRYTYQYSADNGATWAADRLPKSASGNIIPGTYMVKMTYTGKNYSGTKTASFTVVKKPLTVEPGTLAVQNKDYDGTTKATLKKGGRPALSGVVGNDEVSPGGTLKAEYKEKGPKKDIPVIVTGFTLTGKDAGCYQIWNSTLTLKATINKKDSGSSGGNNGGSNNGGSNSGGSNSSGGNSGGSNNSGNKGGTTGKGSTTGKDGTTGKGSTTGKDGTTGKGSTSGKGGTTGKGSTSGKGGTTGKDSTTGKGSTGGKDSTTGTDGTARANGANGGNTAQQPEGNAGQGAGSADAAGQDGGARKTVQTVEAETEDGRIVMPDNAAASGATGSLTEDDPASTRMLVGNGSVVVTVVCEDETYTAGTKDAAAVANAVLTPEQIALADSGETLEVRVDIRDISDSMTPQDMEAVEKGHEAYEKYYPDLTLGGYVDISVYMKAGEGGWSAVTETREPLEVVIGIPEELKGDDRIYYIIRTHEGRYTLLNDMDDVPETITIMTDQFSSYAIAYRALGAAGTDTAKGRTVCGLCHICPTFLGICCYVWLAAGVLITGLLAAVAIVALLRRGREERPQVQKNLTA